LFLIILFTLLIIPHKSIGKVSGDTSNGRLGLPAILYLLLEPGKIQQPIIDYDNDGFDSSVDCNDQASSCTTDCSDSDGDGVFDCLDLCIDNDLDGYGIDNAASIIGNGSVSVSECTIAGTNPCILNETCNGLDCNDGNGNVYSGAFEVCDGLDNDCDSNVDEDYEEEVTNCGLGPCATTGSTSCVNGSVVDSCIPGEPYGEDNNCNGIDDDCNGVPDDAYVGDETICGTGACENTVESICVDGSISVPFCEPLPNSSEICDDGIDNDCNFQTDEGCDLVPPLVSVDSINMAHSSMFDNATLISSVNSFNLGPGSFINSGELGAYSLLTTPFGYEWTGKYDILEIGAYETLGLQTIGADSIGDPVVILSGAYLSQINSDPFLAYTVQVEEDILNQKVLELFKDAAIEENNTTLVNDIEAVLQGAQNEENIKLRDSFLLQHSDAQSGRVSVDSEGNLIRTQQYILRPSNVSVQLISVSLRDTGAHAGMATIDWRTNFNSGYSQNYDLRSLPWNDWLDTKGSDTATQGIIQGTRYVYSDGTLSNMEITITSPGGKHIKETRLFAGLISGIQNISYESLELSGFPSGNGTYTHATNWQTAVVGDEYWIYIDGSQPGYPTQNGGTNPFGYYYMYRYGEYNPDPNLDQIVALSDGRFYVIGDSSGISPGDYSNRTIKDIWTGMQVNESSAPNIGGNNLEIAFFPNGSSSAAIYIMYIPMSRMVWNGDRISPP
jgi:hypothetical protein